MPVADGSRIPARTPTATTIAISQLVCARTPEAASERARRAATGLIEAARRAGSIAATSVMARPATAPAAMIEGEMTGPSRVTPSDARSQPATKPASRTPSATPRAEPRLPSSSACVATMRTTCPRLAPAARSRPSSRTRSTTVIASVLRITNAAANRLMAASSAIVDRTSVVDSRSPASRSCGADRT